MARTAHCLPQQRVESGLAHELRQQMGAWVCGRGRILCGHNFLQTCLRPESSGLAEAGTPMCGWPDHVLLSHHIAAGWRRCTYRGRRAATACDALGGALLPNALRGGGRVGVEDADPEAMEVRRVQSRPVDTPCVGCGSDTRVRGRRTIQMEGGCWETGGGKRHNMPMVRSPSTGPGSRNIATNRTPGNVATIVSGSARSK